MNPTEVQATPEKISQAKDLVSRAGIVSPGTRLMAESIIESKSDTAITELIGSLEAMIAEKEAAYKAFKSKMAEMAKGMLPAMPSNAPSVVAQPDTPATPAALVVEPVLPLTQPVVSTSQGEPPAAPPVDITPPGAMPTL